MEFESEYEMWIWCVPRIFWLPYQLAEMFELYHGNVNGKGSRGIAESAQVRSQR